MVDAARPVTRIAAAVNTSFRSIEGAAAAGAELLLVHHTTWASIDLQLKRRKEKALRAAGVSLYGAHLALDSHDELSPSVVLARRLGVNLVLGSHYATEKHGVQAWAGHVADRFGLPWVFVPEDAGIL